jgi:hypothetical protein
MLTVETASTYNECPSFTQTKYMDDHTRSEIFATPIGNNYFSFTFSEEVGRSYADIVVWFGSNLLKEL